MGNGENLGHEQEVDKLEKEQREIWEEGLREKARIFKETFSFREDYEELKKNYWDFLKRKKSKYNKLNVEKIRKIGQEAAEDYFLLDGIRKKIESKIASSAKKDKNYVFIELDDAVEMVENIKKVANNHIIHYKIMSDNIHLKI